MSEVISDGNGLYIQNKEAVKRIWSESFDDLINRNANQKAEINCQGKRGVQGVRENEYKKIGKTEMEKALKKMKAGKAAGME